MAEQSPNWENRKDVRDEMRDGFPFDEGFPKRYAGKEYELITCSGEHLLGTVDDSRQYASEGLGWRTRSGSKSRTVVIAWKEAEATMRM